MGHKRNKLGKHAVLAKSSKVAGHLPMTRKLKEEHFTAMLKKYRSIVVKPIYGSGGEGVVFVTKRDGGSKYEVHVGSRRKKFRKRSSAYRYVRRKTGSRKRLVQRKISLARIDGRPFDLRVIIQRRRGASKWKVTGKLAKVAGPGYHITNIRRSHGKVLPFTTAVRRSNIRGKSVSAIGHRVDKLSLAATRQLRKAYSTRICGLDIGLDRGGKAWIIEANFTPDNGLFKKLKDKSMYRRIKSYE